MISTNKLPEFTSCLRISMWLIIVIITNCLFVAQTTPNVDIFGAPAQGGSSPIEGNINYYLECSIHKFQPTMTIAVSKDDDIIIWNKMVKPTATEYQVYVRESENGTRIRHFINFPRLTVRHSALYKCFVAEGVETRYAEVASDSIWVSVNSSKGFYFPAPRWPECHPQDDIEVFIGTFVDFTCVSDLGKPQVSIEMGFQDETFLALLSEISISESEIRQTYTDFILAKHHGKSFTCSITSPGEPFRDRTRDCSTGTIKVKLALRNHVTVTNGGSAFLSCFGQYNDTIRWVTETTSQGRRLTMPTNSTDFALLGNVEEADNGTKIACTLVKNNVTDYIQIIVIPKFQLSTQSPAEFLTLPIAIEHPTTLTSLSNQQDFAIIIPVILMGGILIFIAGAVVGVFCYANRNFMAERLDVLGTGSITEEQSY